MDHRKRIWHGMLSAPFVIVLTIGGTGVLAEEHEDAHPVPPQSSDAYPEIAYHCSALWDPTGTATTLGDYTVFRNDTRSETKVSYDLVFDGHSCWYRFTFSENTEFGHRFGLTQNMSHQSTVIYALGRSRVVLIPVHQDALQTAVDQIIEICRTENSQANYSDCAPAITSLLVNRVALVSFRESNGYTHSASLIDGTLYFRDGD